MGEKQNLYVIKPPVSGFITNNQTQCQRIQEGKHVGLLQIGTQQDRVVGWRVLRKERLHNQSWSPNWSGKEERPRERQKAGEVVGQ